MVTEKRFYSLGEVSTILGVSVPTVARWVHRDILPTVKIGGRRLVAIATIEKLIADATTQVPK